MVHQLVQRLGVRPKGEGRRVVVASRRGVDGLGHAPAVVGEQRVGGGDDGGRAAVVDLEVVGAGAGEVPVEVDEPVGAGAGVAVDGLVVVADAEHVGGGSGHQADEQEMGRGQVLELVDQHQAAGPPGGAAGGRFGQEDLDGPDDLFVEVDQVAVVEDGPVAGEHLGEPLHVAAEVLLDRRGRAQAQARRRQGLDPGGERVGHGLAAGLDQVRQDAADLAFVDHRAPGSTGAAGTARCRCRWPAPGC